MKKLLTIFAFAVAVLFGMNNTYGQSLTQNEDRPQVVAKTLISELSPKLELTEDQQRTLFRAFVSREVNYRKYVNGKSLSRPEVAASKKKFDDVFNTILKKNLTPEQYTKWLNLQKQ